MEAAPAESLIFPRHDPRHQTAGIAQVDTALRIADLALALVGVLEKVGDPDHARVAWVIHVDAARMAEEAADGGVWAPNPLPKRSVKIPSKSGPKKKPTPGRVG